MIVVITVSPDIDDCHAVGVTCEIPMITMIVGVKRIINHHADLSFAIAIGGDGDGKDDDDKTVLISSPLQGRMKCVIYVNVDVAVVDDVDVDGNDYKLEIF